MRAPATNSAKPQACRPLRAKPVYVFSAFTSEDSFSNRTAKRYLRTAANDVCLVPLFRDFT
ncbi:hypothetical protein N9V36_03750 [Luminiphilus sp.]|nr:hypothetical protein [Luminiphilus sp.]MDB2316427.1 hypothetical protein [Luminiphilus sp.]MDB2629874.1 hypothetical protein [Luminiphilus sp.]